MTTLAAGWENLGGGVLRKTSAGADQGDTITHPLRAANPGESSFVAGPYNRARWTNATGAFPNGLGAQTADVTASTLAGAFAATPTP